MLRLELMTGGILVVLPVITRKIQSEIGKRYFLFYLLLKDGPFSLTTLESFFLLLSPHLSHELLILTKEAVTMYEILGS